MSNDREIATSVSALSAIMVSEVGLIRPNTST